MRSSTRSRRNILRTFHHLSLVFAAFAGSLLAQPAITDVVNAGSHIGTGLPGAGIAQGAILLVTGQGLGSDPLQQASFPLPTTDGLGGVTVQVAVGDTTVNCIMVYVTGNEVAAILPSSTPAGTGTLTLNNNGATVTAPITVVPAAFGAFTQSRTGAGPAWAFNVGADGSTTLNSLTAPASVGQNIMLNGTGLGAITSDETQSGATDTPSSTVQVWVGLQQATLVSASRGTCCGGIDPTFPVPQGVAGWDVVTFTVPAGVTGCHVPVAVQIGKTVSNFSTIAVADASGGCSDPGGISSSDFGKLTGDTLKVGYINLSRSTIKVTAAGQSISTSSDSGAANFQQYDLTSSQSAANAFGNVTAIGSCIVTTNRLVNGQMPNLPPVINLDAGPAINVKNGSNVSKSMAKSATGGYTADFGTSTQLPSIPGLPPGLPGIPGLPGGGSPAFLEAGNYTSDNGSGGADVKNFTATLRVPTPMTWTNMDAITSVVQSQGVTVNWTGADPSSTVSIFGTSSNKIGVVNVSGVFICTAPASAGTFSVPAIVTLSLPPSLSASGTPTGALALQSTVSNKFTAPGLDFATISSSVQALKNVSYQ
jgi:uncharacterized protein (TIGR03437 family)